MAENEYSDQEFLEFIVKSIVDNPDEVQVDRTVDEMGVLLTLKVAAKDMGQVVGRQGSTAKAIRSLLKIVGVKNNARVNLKIEEPEGGKAPRRRDKETSEQPSQEENEPKEFDMGGTTVGKVIDDIKKDL